MSVLSKYFDKNINQCSPVPEDRVRVVNYDGDNEIVTYEKFDYEAYQKSLGTVDMWSLESLLKAGISPDSPIHTGAPTRLEGLGVVEQASSIADELFEELNKNEKID